MNAKEYFYNLHDVECNQKYDGKLPYSFHLETVYRQFLKFNYLLGSEKDLVYDNRKSSFNYCPFRAYSYSINEIVEISCFAHDSCEDARLTYNDIKSQFGETIAEIVYLCTQDKGRNRAERKSDVWYHAIRKNDLAVFVKLCDIIANVKYSLLTNSSMFKKYKAEYNQKVKPMLYTEQYKDMFNYLDKIFEIE